MFGVKQSEKKESRNLLFSKKKRSKNLVGNLIVEIIFVIRKNRRRPLHKTFAKKSSRFLCKKLLWFGSEKIEAS